MRRCAWEGGGEEKKVKKKKGGKNKFQITRDESLNPRTVLGKSAGRLHRGGVCTGKGNHQLKSKENRGMGKGKSGAPKIVSIESG